MAVEFVIGVVTENLLNQALSFATQEISLFSGCEESLAKLKAGEVKIIQDLLSDVHNKDINSMAVRSWFKKLKAVLFDAENILEEYNYKLLHQNIQRDIKVPNIFSRVINIPFNLKIAHKVKAINSELKRVSEQGGKYGLVNVLNSSSEIKMDRVRTSPAVQESDLVGRDDDVAKVVDMLVSANNEENIALTAIVGMGGQGKTTLAQLVYKHDKVVNHFDKKVWVCISDDFKIERLLGDMVQSLTKSNPNLTTREALISKLQDTLKGKRYLVVFDDVWNEDQQKWELLKTDLLEISGSKGTKILVTTRSKKVVSIMGASKTHDLNKLSDEDSWFLFKKRAFAEGAVVEAPEFVAIGKTLIKKCCGVPLAIKVLGGLLSSKKDIVEWSSIENSDIWSSFENQEGGVMSCIKLSYDHLDSLPLKQCFAYCSIFPKDTELERESLIQQWMAHGFLNPPRGSALQMEDLGSTYFDILLWNSLLQEPTYKGFFRTWSYKMHDIVHDFALKISKNYCFTMEESCNANDVDKAMDEAAVHVSLIDINIPKGISSKIRTLRLCLPKGVKFSNGSTFGTLRSLILSTCELEELPISIGRLKLLRNLDIKDSQIRTLPDSYIKLYNLQTLRLPLTFKQEVLYVATLVNLRHIYLRNDSCRIVGIKQLIHLQTLTHFIVSNENGCNIDELENLDNLRGSLCIVGLHKVVKGEEARKANISKKVKIHHLQLLWTYSVRETVNEEDVLEGLIPHSFLKTLKIEYFKGLRFPSWMTTNSRLLINLMEIKLEGCDLVEQLPSLGHLPHLLKVEISGLNNVKRIGAEFYGCSDDLNLISCAFPALEELIITWMSNLEEWLGVEQLSPSLQAFPHLRRLLVSFCSKLSDLPLLTSLTSLTKLSVEVNMQLTEIPSLQGVTSLTELSIARNGKLTNIVSLEGLSSLTKLSIKENAQLTEIPSLQGLTSLTNLSIEWNAKLTKIVSLEGLSSLAELSIKENKQLTEFPSLQGLTSLTMLSIESNRKLTTILSLQVLSTLARLSIIGNEQLTEIPLLQGLSSLAELSIKKNKQLTEFPSLQGLTSLTKLSIEWNENLTTIVSIQGLSSLVELSVEGNKQLTTIVTIQDLTSCKMLSIKENERLIEIPSIQGLTSLTKLSIVRNKKLTTIVSLEGLSYLAELSVIGNNQLTEIPSLKGLTSLTKLSVGCNEKLTKIVSLEGLSSLEELLIEGNKQLTELPIGIQSCMSLHTVSCLNNKSLQRIDGLERLPNLRELNIGWFSEDMYYFPWPHKNNEDNHLYFSSLMKLELYGWPKLTSLPEQLQYLPSLTSLSIWYFDELEALPEWMANIQSLSSLRLAINENLKYMPSVKAMQRLTNLQELRILHCPHLKERCTRGSGREWHKISHIQNIEMDLREYKVQCSLQL